MILLTANALCLLAGLIPVGHSGDDDVAIAAAGETHPSVDGIPVDLDADPGSREWSVRLTAVGRSLQGQVQVREHEVQGTPLSLSWDLGYGFQLGGRAGLTYARADVETLFEVEYLDGSASRSASRDFSFNGAFYSAGEDTRTLTHFLTVRLHLAWKSFSEPGSGWWTGPLLGIEYPYYYMNLTLPSVPHNSEDWTHYYPYPVIGWADRVRLAEGLSWGGRATVGYFPDLPSAFTEGGRPYVSVRPSVWVDLPLTWDVSHSIRLSAGFEYQYWHGGDHSVEDGNVLRFSSAGGTLALEFVG